MFKYLIAFVLCSPLIGIWIIEGGEYVPAAGADGYPNGASIAYLAYALTLLVTAWIFSLGGARASVSPARVSGRDFALVARRALYINGGFLILFLFGFGAIDVWSGAVGKGEFRAGLGGFGFFPNLMTKFVVPALLAYLAMLYTATDKDRGAKLWWTLNAAVAFTIGASWGFKSTAVMILVPGLLILYWRITLGQLVKLGLFFILTLVVFFYLFDADLEAYGDVHTFLIHRITVLQGDVSWHVWRMYIDNELFPNYWPTLLAALGDTPLTFFGLDRENLLEWMQYHYDWMITNIAGSPLEQIADGHSVTGTPFSEGIVAGGILGVGLYAVLGGFLVGRAHRVIRQSILKGAYFKGTMMVTYFSFFIFPWLNGGAVVQLFHVSLVVGIGLTVIAIRCIEAPAGQPVIAARPVV